MIVASKQSKSEAQTQQAQVSKAWQARQRGVPDNNGGMRILLPGTRTYLLEIREEKYWKLFDSGLISAPLMYGEMIAGRPE